jgi:hypothetical protein
MVMRYLRLFWLKKGALSLLTMAMTILPLDLICSISDFRTGVGSGFSEGAGAA